MRMRRFFELYKPYIRHKRFILNVAFSFLLLGLSFIVNFYAGLYATERASNAVTDIILSNIPVFDVDAIFIYGPFLMWLFVVILGVLDPKKAPFVLKSVTLFILIRSVFITLTHLGPFPTQIPVDISGVVGRFTFGADLFFSAHTGLPFLMALVFWREKFLRHFFVGLSLFFGAVVLMGHLHYSIDVLAAFFITYTIFHLSIWLFPNDRKLLLHGLPEGTP